MEYVGVDQVDLNSTVTDLHNISLQITPVFFLNLLSFKAVNILEVFSVLFFLQKHYSKPESPNPFA